MTKLILTLPYEQDADWLLPMLARLGVRVKPLEQAISPEQETMHRTIIEAGGDDRENFESYLNEFEISRQDRKLPLRD